MHDAPQLDIAVSLGPDRARIFLCGELDLNTVETFRTRLDETLTTKGDNRRSLVVLDLSDVTFCDSTGLHTLLDAASRCRQLGVTLRLVNVVAAVHRVMELTGTLGQFNVEVDLRPQRPVPRDTIGPPRR
jgi:anti-anti-sigma factor